MSRPGSRSRPGSCQRPVACPKGQEGAEAIRQAVDRLRREYGPQGWWPVTSERRQFAGCAGPREAEGYHPGQYDFPRTRRGRFEICCGAVLTQNTAWQNVQRALSALGEQGWLKPDKLLTAPPGDLALAIRPAGYFNQKSEYLRAMATWFLGADRPLTEGHGSDPWLESARAQLLTVRGIGPETADCILLYAYSLPTFVVDAYTRRVFGSLGLVQPEDRYETIRERLGSALVQSDRAKTVELYQEAHALIVEHAKRYHGRKTGSAEDFLRF